MEREKSLRVMVRVTEDALKRIDNLKMPRRLSRATRCGILIEEGLEAWEAREAEQKGREGRW